MVWEKGWYWKKDGFVFGFLRAMNNDLRTEKRGREEVLMLRMKWLLPVNKKTWGCDIDKGLILIKKVKV